MTNNALIAALVKTQLEITPPKKDKVNPRFKSSYCSLDSIYDACRIPLAKNGLSLTHTVLSDGAKHFLETNLLHVSGERLTGCMPMFIDQMTSQGFASALTYARKYAVCSLLGLPTEEDDDGEAAVKEQVAAEVQKVQSKPLNKDQIEEIDVLIEDDMELLNRILTGYKVNKLGEIASEHFSVIVKNLRARKNK